MSFRLADPLWLLLLLFVPLLMMRLRRDSGAALKFSSLRLFHGIKPPKTLMARQFLAVLRVSSVILLVVALARPQAGRKQTEVISEGIDLMLVIDVSPSMEAMDFSLQGKPAPRLEVVKQVVQEFIRAQAGNRLGLVVFGSEAFTQCPLTLDYGVLLSFVERLTPGMAGEATAVGSAIGVATTRLKDLPAKDKVMILLTDGVSNAGPVAPLDAAEAARSLGVKVYTVGIGTNGFAPFPRKTIFGTIMDQVRTEYDGDTLKRIAEVTLAQHFQATDTDTLQKIYDTIGKLEKTEKKVKEHVDYQEFYPTFLAGGLLLLLLEIVLANTRLRKLP